MNTEAKRKQKPTVKISPAQFVEAYYKNGKNGTRAIKELDQNISDTYAAVKASETLRNPKVQYLMGKVEEMIQYGAFKGINRLLKAIDSDNEQVAVVASKDLADRAGYKAPDKKQIDKRITISLGDGLAKPIDK